MFRLTMRTDGAQRRLLSRLSEIVLVVGLLGAVLGVLALAGWRPASRASIWYDLPSYYVPKYDYAAERLAAGEIPLWNPFELSGIPFLAALQYDIFYPPVRLAYAVAAGDTALVLCFFLHLALGGIGGYLLARAFGCRPSTAVLAAGWVVQPAWLGRFFDYPVIVASVAWVPWLILGLRRAVDSPGRRTAAWLALAAVLELLAGYAPFILALVYLAPLALVCFTFDTRDSPTPRHLRRIAATIVGALALTLLVTAVQLLPTLELAALTDRAAAAARGRGGMSSVLEQWPGLADHLGIPQPTVAEYVPFLWREVGPLVLPLAALGLALGRRRGSTWWAAGTLVLCLLPFDVHGRLPLGGLVRNGFEWICLLPFVMFLLAGLGLELALRAAGVRRALVPAILAIGVLAATTTWNWSSAPNARSATRGAPSEPPHASLIRECEEGARFRTFWADGQRFGAPMRYRMRSTAGYEQALIPARASTLLTELGFANGGLPGDWAHRLRDRQALAGRMALRCVVTSQRTLDGAAFERLTPPTDRIAVYRNRDARPRASLAYETRLAASRAEALRLLLTAPREAVVLEGEPPATTSCDVPAAGEVEITEDRPERVVVNVQTSCPGWLVLADGYMPGWTARLDGATMPIRIADVGFRAVAVPAGTHVVVFTYAPWTFRAGVALSVLGLVIVGVLLGRNGHPATAPLSGRSDASRG